MIVSERGSDTYHALHLKWLSKKWEQFSQFAFTGAYQFLLPNSTNVQTKSLIHVQVLSHGLKLLESFSSVVVVILSWCWNLLCGIVHKSNAFSYIRSQNVTSSCHYSDTGLVWWRVSQHCSFNGSKSKLQASSHSVIQVVRFSVFCLMDIWVWGVGDRLKISRHENLIVSQTFLIFQLQSLICLLEYLRFWNLQIPYLIVIFWGFNLSLLY